MVVDQSYSRSRSGYQIFQILTASCGVTRIEASPETLRASFDNLDADKDGLITIKELEDAAPKLGVEVKDIKLMMKAGDKNKDGKIDFDEFKALFDNHK